jgi:ribosomal protein L6P/L9E
MTLIENTCNTMTTIVANKSSDVSLGLIESIVENFVTGVSNVLNSSLDGVNSTMSYSTDAKIITKENKEKVSL